MAVSLGGASHGSARSRHARRRRPRRGRARRSAGSATLTHDTSRSSFFVHYRFHPLHGQEVVAIALPRRADGAVTVKDRDAGRLKIPLWMLSPAASRFDLTAQAMIRPRALVLLHELLNDFLDRCEKVESEEYAPLSTGSDTKTEGSDEATHARVRKRMGSDRLDSVRSGDPGAAGDVDGAGGTGRRRGRSHGRRRGQQ